MLQNHFSAKYSLSMFFVIHFIFCSTSSFAEDFYKWVDANGSTHYTRTPPPKNIRHKTVVETYGWKTPTNAPSQSPVPTNNQTFNHPDGAIAPETSQNNPATHQMSEPALAPATTLPNTAPSPSSKTFTHTSVSPVMN
ncbi:DUF4124 domain-containing protein [Acinetobacter gerneri]